MSQSAAEVLEQFQNPYFAEYVQYAVKRVAAGDKFEGKLLAAIKTYPVSIREFITSPEYLDQGDSIYPLVLDELVKINNPKIDGLNHGLRIGNIYAETVLTGGIGTGKTHIALLSIAYSVYVLSCLSNPQSLFDLDKSSEILFIFQSLNATLSKQLDYARFKHMIETSPYFKNHFLFDKNIDSELRFPNRIIVRSVNGQETATIGQNVFGGMLDEVNFMEVTENSKKATDGGEYDQAIALYHSILSRRKSRFMKMGRLFGMFCLVSSKRYPNQFTDRKVKEAKAELQKTGKTSIYVYDKRKWEIKPDDFCGKTFRVFIGDISRKPRLLGTQENISMQDQALVDNVPVEYRKDFEIDIMRALREIAGHSTLALHPFIMNVEAMSACFGKRKSILTSTVTDFEYPKLKFISSRFTNPEYPRWAHVDLSLTGDSTGIAIGHVPRFTKIKRGGDIVETLPVIAIDCTLEVRPPKGGEILFEKIRKLLYLLRDSGLNIKWVTFDQYQSADSIQILRQKGFVTGKQSMDKTSIPYEFTKMALYDGRIEAPSHDKLIEELQALELDAKKGKIDHPPQGSKDIADALAGVIYGLTRRCEIWAHHQISLIEYPASLQSITSNIKEQEHN